MSHRRILNPLLSQQHRWFVGSLVVIVFALAFGSAIAADSLAIEAVSNRADLVSGGDALVRVILPAGVSEPQAVLSLNGQALANALHAAPDGRGFLALVTGLNLGHNSLVLAAGGSSVQLDVTNYPIGGPVFSGPHLQPWTCTTSAAGLGAPLDADCNAAPQFAFFYKNATTNAFAAYDPANPPPAAQIAMTTTDQGLTVPYIVRVETGALNRSIYKITVLFDPAQPWLPWAPQPQWNGKVLHMFGAGAGTMYTQGTLNNAFDDNSLSRGFATTAATLTNHGTIANTKLNAETLMMVKEHLAEAYGPHSLYHRSGLFWRRDPAAQHRRPVSRPPRWAAPAMHLSRHLVALRQQPRLPALYALLHGDLASDVDEPCRSVGGDRTQLGTGVPGTGRTACLRYPLLRGDEYELRASGGVAIRPGHQSARRALQHEGLSRQRARRTAAGRLYLPDRGQRRAAIRPEPRSTPAASLPSSSSISTKRSAVSTSTETTSRNAPWRTSLACSGCISRD